MRLVQSNNISVCQIQSVDGASDLLSHHILDIQDFRNIDVGEQLYC